jgi:hypothetical protein
VGVARPGGCCPPGAPPSGDFCTNNSQKFRKKIVSNFQGNLRTLIFQPLFIARKKQKTDKTWHFILFN